MTAWFGRSTCYRCFRPREQCLCTAIPRVENRTPVLIVQHPRERTHPFGTARLAALGLTQVEVLVDHAGCLRRNPSALGALAGAALLYPHAQAREVTSLPEHERPRKLIVIDGTWHQARTLYRDLPVLHALPHLTLPGHLRSSFELRRQPAEHCLSTIEAIVFALRALEPETAGAEALLDAFAAMQRRQLALPRAFGRQRKKRRAAASRAIPRALVEHYSSLVVAYAESCRDRGGTGERQLLCCAAVRPSTGEGFYRLIQRAAVGPAQLAQLGLDPDAPSRGVSLERFRAEWHQFSRPGDLLATWNSSTLALLETAAREPPRGLSLKSVYFNLKRFRGSLEEIVAAEGFAPALPGPWLDAAGAPLCAGRAATRLSHALCLAEFLHGRAQAGAAENDAAASCAE